MNFSNIGIALGIAACFTFSCNTKNESWEGNISGKAQKGPFINGSSISIFELNDELAQTGESFNAQIENHTGSFNLNGISLASSYILFRADGFYFNEICGTVSETQITLNGIADVTESNAFNLNVLTHLEKDRVLNLVQSGLGFAEAKNQAQSELLEVFSISNTTGVANSELLDITGSSNGDAIMLAISCILQGHRTESSLSATLADFILDFRNDGEINGTSLMADLVLHAHSLNLQQIRLNVETRYQDLGVSITVPNFEQYVDSFLVAHPSTPLQSIVGYPQNGQFGLNVLSLNDSVFMADSIYSFSANMPDKCMGVVLEVSKISGATCNIGCWSYSHNPDPNWEIEEYNFTNDSQRFTSSGLECNLWIDFSPGIYLFEYFEGGVSTPTFSKVVEFVE